MRLARDKRLAVGVCCRFRVKVVVFWGGLVHWFVGGVVCSVLGLVQGRVFGVHGYGGRTFSGFFR